MSEQEPAQLASPEETLYAALGARYGLCIRGSLQDLQRARARLVREDDAMTQISVLGPDPEGRIWLVRKDKLGG